LVMSVWVTRDLLYSDRHLFLKIWEDFCYYFAEYFPMALVCISFLSIPMIHRLGFLMAS
jgi:hypothetical protein